MFNLFARYITLIVCAFICISSAGNAHSQTQDTTPIELSGFSLSQAFEIADGLPLDLEDDKFRKLLYRIKKTSNNNLQKYSRFTHDVTWKTITEETADVRLRVFDRTGRIRSLTKILLPGANRDDSIKGIYLCGCETMDGQRFAVASLSAPRVWQTSENLNQPIRFDGFLFGTIEIDGPVDQSNAVPLFISKRLAWFPESPDATYEVTPAHVALAAKGVDVGQFDLVRQQNTKSLGDTDSEIFFQMLGGVDEVSEEQLPGTPLGFSELMAASTTNFGNTVSFQARVRTCSPIQLTNPDLIERLGFQSYYQLIVFPDLDSQQIVVKNKGGDDLTYTRFPVTFCVRNLPDNMKPADIENKQIQVNGYYFRFWSYQSDRTDAANTAGQISPLIIGSRPVMIISDEGTLNFLLGAVSLSMLFAVFAMYWIFRNANRQKNSGDGSTVEVLPEKIDVSGIEDSVEDSI